ncbi:phospholipase D-like domain-containing protein [Insolitispirillum peregrinum]|uniref:Phospholipase D n=1 Tax=Insolitispirillum peregrinum TaxID=80876 RepID=A0A1N7P292_9PROT|nr:phosphatidylserine/phosphatidylglycerophosphate/cardiolipin synthase family protein [Insolitispirillum peregrinum]SIT04703.1 cardiolipin synthase [Insolitispirillum peregrinum]
MISPISRQYTLDLTSEPLGPGWLRRSEARPESNEAPADGLWRTGPEGRFRSAMIAALDGAQELVQGCAFLFADKQLSDALLRAADRGVRVYLLTASEQRIGKHLQDDQDFDRRMADEHKQLLDRLAGKVLVRSAEHLHAKFLLIDSPRPSVATGFVSTANFNRALDENIELGIRLDGNEAVLLALYFNWVFWCEAERELIGKGRLMPVSSPPAQPQDPYGASQPLGQFVVATLRASQGLRASVLRLISQAKDEILLASYGIELDHAATQALLKALQSGVAVTILTRPRPAVSAALSAFAKAGARIVGHDKLHAKALVADQQALVMSANLESGGLDTGFEVGVLCSGKRTEEVRDTLLQWIEAAPWQFRHDATRGDHLGDFLPAEKGLRDGVEKVIPLTTQRCGSLVAPDALRLEAAPRPRLEPAPPRGELPQQVTFHWEVEPPRLPRQARLRKAKAKLDQSNARKGDKMIEVLESTPEIYDHGGKVYVLVKGSADIVEAERLAAKLSAIVVVQ